VPCLAYDACSYLATYYIALVPYSTSALLAARILPCTLPSGRHGARIHAFAACYIVLHGYFAGPASAYALLIFHLLQRKALAMPVAPVTGRMNRLYSLTPMSAAVMTIALRRKEGWDTMSPLYVLRLCR